MDLKTLIILEEKGHRSRQQAGGTVPGDICTVREGKQRESSPGSRDTS